MATTIDGTVRAIGAALRENLTSVTKEPLPTEFTELLRPLKEAEAVKGLRPSVVGETKVADGTSEGRIFEARRCDHLERQLR